MGRTDADYFTRIHHLDGSQSGGLNGPFLLDTDTVHDNGQGDLLIGGQGGVLDWFFAGLTDTLKKKRRAELLTTI
jgi:hypothetical protein